MFRIAGIALGLVSLVMLLNLCGCGDDSSSAPAMAVPAGKGVIHGKVILQGTPPVMGEIPNSHGVKDESIIVGSSGGLKNVIVFLKDAPRTGLASNAPVILDQIHCQYVPHVLAMQAGQTLRLKSSDDVMHNVNIQSRVNPSANFGFSTIGQRDAVIKLAEDPFPVKCDIHPWMKAWIGVFSNPWFAVTADDGSFTIQNIPAGTYSLSAWQEALPQQEQKVTVNDTTPAEIQFTFQAP